MTPTAPGWHPPEGCTISSKSFPGTVEEIVSALQRGDEESSQLMDSLLLEHAGLMRHMVARSGGRPTDFDVHLQEARIAFVAAVRVYRRDRGASFSAFASLVMRRAIRREIMRSATAASTFQQFPDGSEDANESSRGLSFEDRVAVRAAVSALPDPEKRVVHALFWKQHSQAEAAAALGISQQAVSKRRRSALLSLAQTLSA